MKNYFKNYQINHATNSKYNFEHKLTHYKYISGKLNDLTQQYNIIFVCI